jgi:hypothetical protein
MTEMEDVYECVIKLEESYYSIMQENVAYFDERNIALMIAKSKLYNCLAQLECLLLQKS